MVAESEASLQLPLGVVTRADLGRLQREAEAADSFLDQAAIRQPGTELQLPKTSHLFEELVTANHLNLLQVADRQRLHQLLEAAQTTAPILHISFSTDPSPLFLQRLITWVRQEMHPTTLLQIGLHPSIGAGCVVRTTNKYYDFSLRQRFTAQRALLLAKLRERPPAAVPAKAVAP